MNEEVKKAIWYLRDYGTNMINSDFRSALEIVLNYVNEIESKMQLEKDDKTWQKTHH